MDRSRTVIVGAGPAGLAAAAMLGREGIHAVVLERAPHVAASWRTHYDRLRLHTTRSLSDLPDYRLPRRYGRWVPRDGVVTYLEEYATYHCLEIQFGTNVERIDRGAGHWRLETSRGAVEAPCVVVATGYNHSPFLPHWPGCERFAGELVHSSAYRNARPYRGRDVLVVGAGNSGAEIAVDLVEGGARQVWLSIRTPPQIVPRQALGIPAQLVGVAIRRMPLPLADWIVALLQKLFVGDLSSYGLLRPSTGLYSQFLRTDVIPIIDVGLIEALKRRQVQVVSAVERFHNGEVLLRDGNWIAPEIVVAATGYRRGLKPLVGRLGVLGPNGRPAAHGPKAHPRAPGPYFIGFTNPISGTLREIGIEARKIARAVAKDSTRSSSASLVSFIDARAQ